MLKINMMRICIKTLLAVLWFISGVSFAAATHWQTLKPGLSYARIQMPVNKYSAGSISAFRVSLQHYELVIASAKLQTLTVKQLVQAHRALIGVNGGFFTPVYQPLGLRISEGKIKNKVRPISWWGVFYVRDNHAHIVAQKSYHYSKQIDFAIQAGPRLVIAGRIPKLKQKITDRTALGIDKQGRVIILVTDQMALSTRQLATIMRTPTSQGGLGCVNALNLDGGSSTQLYAHIDQFKLDVPSFAPVSDAVLVKVR